VFKGVEEAQTEDITHEEGGKAMERSVKLASRISQLGFTTLREKEYEVQ
jgi:hypothetical protein